MHAVSVEQLSTVDAKMEEIMLLKPDVAHADDFIGF